MPPRRPGPKDYLSLEKGGWKKKWKGKQPVALVFPNHYQLGMSNLGFQLVYGLLNALPDIVCERIFLPEDNSQPLSIESGRPLRDFPLILCSVSFEDDFVSLVRIFRMGGIEPLAEVRYPEAINTQGFPLIIGGGVATFINPEPLAPFIDFFVVGEAESILPQLVSYLAEKISLFDRGKLLADIVQCFSGCYVPQFYNVDYLPDGTIGGIKAMAPAPDRVRKVVTYGSDAVGHSVILTPETEFADMFLAELGRGCSRGCRFCAAGFVYRPPRLWSADAVISSLHDRPANSRRVGLLGMEMAKPDDLAKIAKYLVAEGCLLSFSSLRADAFSDSLVELLSKSNLKSAAIAPDGGSERLRRVINKGIVEDDVLRAAETLVQAGVTNLKMYFMIGLPTETMDDMLELVALVKKVQTVILVIGKARGYLSNITISVNSFVPKAWTPFQFHPFADLDTLKERIKFLRKELGHLPNMKIIADQPLRAYFQAVIARGDRRLGPALLSLVDSGKKWTYVFKEHGLSPENYAMRPRTENELFPWEIIDHGINRSYLWSEYQRALFAKSTPVCDTKKCRRCGVCNDK
ncbi:MAG: radical SAM protein [Proteobacteria bacterium]|nr:radical SAM protein [Pseudomonadota bacterium]MBU1717326.1 radical SAM protein [Pseudomonadota bacterium]